jgi:hypothetical protein
MVDQSLINYIWSYLQQGYDAEAIRSALLNQGYDEKSIDAAFSVVYESSAYHGQVRKRPVQQEQRGWRLTKAEVVAGALLLLGIVIIAALAFAMFNTSSEAPGPSETYVPPPNNTVEEVQEPPAQTHIPKVPPEEIIIDNETINEDVDNSEPVEEQPLQESPGSLSRLQIDQRVDDLASSDPIAAAQYCPQIITQNGKNSCYARVAHLSGQSQFCVQVSTEKERDFCYLQFAIDGLGTQEICTSINDVYRRESCLQLLLLQEELDASEQRMDEDVPVYYADEVMPEEVLVDERFMDENVSA